MNFQIVTDINQYSQDGWEISSKFKQNGKIVDNEGIEVNADSPDYKYKLSKSCRPIIGFEKFAVVALVICTLGTAWLFSRYCTDSQYVSRAFSKSKETKILGVCINPTSKMDNILKIEFFKTASPYQLQNMDVKEVEEAFKEQKSHGKLCNITNDQCIKISDDDLYVKILEAKIVEMSASQIDNISFHLLTKDALTSLVKRYAVISQNLVQLSPENLACVVDVLPIHRIQFIIKYQEINQKVKDILESRLHDLVEAKRFQDSEKAQELQILSQM